MRMNGAMACVLAVCLATLAACGSDSQGPAPDALRDTAADVAPDPAADAFNDGILTDGVADAKDPGTAEAELPRDDDADAAEATDVPDDGPDGAACTAGAPGCPCQKNSDCDGGYCLETLDGYACATPCLGEDSCPKGWRCAAIEGVLEPTYACIAPARLCRPCKSDDDCALTGPGRNLCLEHGPDGRFCGMECTADTPCPDGYDCQQVTAQGQTLGQCRPTGEAECPCPKKFVDQGYTTLCYVKNDAGTCSAERSCAAACTAQTPAAETCNGADDDCNGQTDDHVPPHACPLKNAYGTCQGVAQCLGGGTGTEICEGTYASQETCNKIDDNCDGQTDEAGTPDCKVYFRDGDQDGYGVDDDSVCVCAAAAPYTATVGGDCDDNDPQVHGGGTETCNGLDDDCNGQTDEGTDPACSPYVCSHTAAGCGTTCATSTDCLPGFQCGDGKCRLAKGVQCAADADCASTFCTDGFCCEARCDGSCERCNAAGRHGSCDAVQAEDDPDGECAAQAAATCGRVGTCSGTRSCELYPATTLCTAATCDSPTVSHRAATCDGTGGCIDNGTDDCTPFLCDDGNGLCRKVCTADGQCGGGFQCATGVCLKSDGQGCAVDGECAHAFCTDGFCCGSRCDGTCERCSAPGHLGECAAIPEGTDPGDECAPADMATCGLDGTCSGQRTCRLFVAGTTCIEPACLDTFHARLTDACDGAGTCVDGGARDCSPYVCADAVGACKVTCGSGAECATGYACTSAVCKKVVSQPCAADGDCALGFCTDGVCCESRCGGTCESCNQDGFAGSCLAIAKDTDPAGECAQAAVAGCGLTGWCSGARTCQLYAAGQVCNPASCPSATTSLAADTCDGAGQCVKGAAYACYPFTCDSGSGLCRASCANTNECQAGYVCASSTCRKAVGEACTADLDCGTGFCTDAVCCQARCGGTCESCNQFGRLGACDAIPAGQDPGDECAQGLVSTCGLTGFCSGSRTCQLFAKDVPCVAATCDAPALSHLSATCSGAGACNDNGTLDCTPFACNAASGLCRLTCVQGSDCASGYECAGGTCKRVSGTGCTSQAQCSSGFCFDGVCCATDCGGICRSCNLAGSIGTCTSYDPGTDPKSQCADQGPTGCGQDGNCDGFGACRRYAGGTECAPSRCAATATFQPTATCNGTGTCNVPATVDCSPYRCGSGACLTTCGTSLDCIGGYDCVGGTCLRSSGQACQLGSQCASSFCNDGVCCGTDCTGLCRACNQAGFVGTCKPYDAGNDPKSQCGDAGSATCGLDGTCDGAGACRLYSSSTQCEAANCPAASTLQVARLCSGGGTCTAPLTVNCAPYLCDGTLGACKATCASGTDCVTGYDCVGGTCLLTTGRPCVASSQCATGQCWDGVCCGQACGGTCRSCNLAGQVGLCRPYSAGVDPDNDCPVQAVSTCGNAGGCDGTGSCRQYAAGTVCSAQTCAGHVQQNAQTCNGSGTCSAPTQTDCSPYQCGAVACIPSCNNDSNCVSGFYCNAGHACVPLKAVGGPCGSAHECINGQCVDGACCSSPCTGACRSCNLPGTEGTCTLATAIADPRDDCVALGTATCGTTGLCDGAGACARYPAATVCAASTCSGTTQNDTRHCDGSGTCSALTTTDCSPYRCGPTACNTTCSDDTGCVAGSFCDGAGHCVPKNATGLSCSAGNQCVSNACCSSVCRDLLVDAANCGTCGLQCHNLHGTTSCDAGTCAPACTGLWGDCDTDRANGCEQTLTTLTDCGACHVPCTRPNAVATCGTGTCAISSCSNGYANCNGTDADGCEANLIADSNTAQAPEYLGSIAGDKNAELVSVSRSGSRWFTLQVREDDTAFALFAYMTSASIYLDVPAGTNYDLFVFSDCTGSPIASASTTGSTEHVDTCWTDRNTSPFLGVCTANCSDTLTLRIHVVMASGNNCTPYTLRAQGNTRLGGCSDGFTCAASCGCAL